MDTINLSLSVDKVNMILAALGNAPYVQVANLIAEIQGQAQSQITTKENNEPGGASAH
jgi:hypothetical protein